MPGFLLRAVAVEASVHPVTVARVIARRPTRAATRARVVKAIERIAPEYLARATTGDAAPTEVRK
jgi:DNA-binding LacI/PurR family transcriptional regulator